MKKVLILSLFLFFQIFVNAQDAFCEKIVVQGKASVKQTPELVNFNVAFNVENTNYQVCASEAIQKMDSLRTLFMEEGLDVDLIKTSNYSVQDKTEFDFVSKRNEKVGYQARIPFKIQTSVKDKTTEKIFKIFRSNFEPALNISFELSQSQIEEVKEKLLELAVQDATSKAKILARNLNLKLGSVNKVQYGEPQAIQNFTQSNFVVERRMDLTGSVVSESGMSTITPSQIQMSTSVMIAWGIEN